MTLSRSCRLTPDPKSRRCAQEAACIDWRHTPAFFARAKKAGKENTPRDLPSAALRVPCAPRCGWRSGTRRPSDGSDNPRSDPPATAVLSCAEGVRKHQIRRRGMVVQRLVSRRVPQGIPEAAERCLGRAAASSFRAEMTEERRVSVRRTDGNPEQWFWVLLPKQKYPAVRGRNPASIFGCAPIGVHQNVEGR
jgi:hypothetical protein